MRERRGGRGVGGGGRGVAVNVVFVGQEKRAFTSSLSGSSLQSSASFSAP